jgi:hypothetical protein
VERIEQKYYKNGALREEVHYRGNVPHGPWRRWHENGKLAEEYWLEDGAYTNGVMRKWDENGVLRSEVPWLRGKQVGRMSIYGPDGKVVSRVYSLEGGIVTRKQYETACEHRHDLPRYVDENGGAKIVPESRPATKVRPISQLDVDNGVLAEILDGPKSEALVWLTGSTQERLRTLGEVGHQSSLEFVQKLYELGADKVLVAQIHSVPGVDVETSNDLVVQLPLDPEARRRLFQHENVYAFESGFSGEQDQGQKYLYWKLA